MRISARPVILRSLKVIGVVVLFSLAPVTATRLRSPADDEILISPMLLILDARLKTHRYNNTRTNRHLFTTGHREGMLSSSVLSSQNERKSRKKPSLVSCILHEERNDALLTMHKRINKIVAPFLQEKVLSTEQGFILARNSPR